MNPQGERWTAERVLALAPDATSRKAGGTLATPGPSGPWSETGSHGQGVWGVCAGSGGKPYRTVVDLHGPGYRCGCPSRKLPCKHALALLLLWSAEESVPIAAQPPDWAEQWLSERRERTRRQETGTATPQPGATAGPADPEAARRRAERRAQRVALGASELERRLTDLLRDGLAGADGAGYAAWEETAARMVDAQAPGLASRVREMSTVPASGPGWPGRLLEECALVHLLNQSMLHIDQLPAELAATARSRVGFTIDTAEVLAKGTAVRDRWLVLGHQDSGDAKLTTRRIWLRGERTGRMALLLSFGAAGRSPELTLRAGLVLDADLTYYPAARPLRAALGTGHAERVPPPRSAAVPSSRSTPAPRSAPSPESAWAASPGSASPSASEGSKATSPVPPGVDITSALALYGSALRDDPWLDAWPVVLSQVTPLPGDTDGWQLADVRSGTALPVDPQCSGRSSRWLLTAISGGGPLTVFGECGHRGFTPVTAWDPAPVPL